MTNILHTAKNILFNILFFICRCNRFEVVQKVETESAKLVSEVMFFKIHSVILLEIKKYIYL